MPKAKNQQPAPSQKPQPDPASGETSSPTHGRLSDPITVDENFPSSSSPQDSDPQVSYSPPGAAPVPSAPPSSTGAKASSRKSSTASTPPKTPAPPKLPRQSVEPKRHHVHGTGGEQYLIFAAATFSDEKFADYYLHRAERLMLLHSGKEQCTDSLARLEGLLED
jgi:hypothetical protein